MKTKRTLFTVLGCLFLALGAIGVFIPIMPTTPFILLSAACFSAGNSKVATWLRNNRFFGPYLENFKTKQGVSLSLKVISILFVWLGLGISMLIVRIWWVCIILGAVGIGVTIHLLMIKTKRRVL